MIGLAIGAVAGLVAFFVFRGLADRADKPEAGKVLRIVAWSDLVVLPLLGFLIGKFVFV